MCAIYTLMLSYQSFILSSPRPTPERMQSENSLTMRQGFDTQRTLLLSITSVTWAEAKKTKSITDKQASVSSYRYVAGQAIVAAQVVSCRGHLQRPAVDARRHRRVRLRPAPDPGFQRQHLAQLIGPDS